MRRIRDFDRRAMDRILGWRNAPLNAFFRLYTVTAWGGFWALWVIVLASILLGTKGWEPTRFFEVFSFQDHSPRSALEALFLATLAPGCAWVIVTGIKRIVRRKRPWQDSLEETGKNPSLTWSSEDDSFPSGHAASSFAYATALCLLGHPALATGVFAWAIGIAFSRVYLAVHYPSDVAAGALVGAIVGGVVGVSSAL